MIIPQYKKNKRTSIISIGILLSSIFSFEKPKEISNEKNDFTETLNDNNLKNEEIMNKFYQGLYI